MVVGVSKHTDGKSTILPSVFDITYCRCRQSIKRDSQIEQG